MLNNPTKKFFYVEQRLKIKIVNKFIEHKMKKLIFCVCLRDKIYIISTVINFLCLDATQKRIYRTNLYQN